MKWMMLTKSYVLVLVSTFTTGGLCTTTLMKSIQDHCESTYEAELGKFQAERSEWSQEKRQYEDRIDDLLDRYYALRDEKEKSPRADEKKRAASPEKEPDRAKPNKNKGKKENESTRRYYYRSRY